MSVIIRLQGLSWSASAMDIRNFFQGLNIPPGGVRIIGGEKGDAFIAFSTDEDARQAMMLTTKHLNGSPVQLFLSSKTEMQNTILQAKDRGVVPGVASTAVSAPTVMPQIATPTSTVNQQINLGQQTALSMPLSSQAMPGMGATQQPPPMMAMQQFHNVFPGGNMPPTNLLNNVLSAISQSTNIPTSGDSQTPKAPNQPQNEHLFPREYAMGGMSQHSHFMANAFQGHYRYESPVHPFNMGQQGLINQNFPLLPNLFGNKPENLINQLPSQAPNQMSSEAANQIQSQAPNQMPSQAPNHMPSQAPNQMQSQPLNQMPSQAPNQLPSQPPNQLPSQPPNPSCFHTNEPSHMWGGGLQFNTPVTNPNVLPKSHPNFSYGDAHKNMINMPGKAGISNPFGTINQPNSSDQHPVFASGIKPFAPNSSYGIANQPDMNEPPSPLLSSANKPSLLGNPVNQPIVNEQRPALVPPASKQGSQQYNRPNEGYGYPNKPETQKDTIPPANAEPTDFLTDKRDAFGRNIRLQDRNNAQPVENENKKQETSKPDDQHSRSRDRLRRGSPRDYDRDKRDRSRRDRDRDDDRNSRRGSDRDRDRDRKSRDHDSSRRDRNRDSERKNIDSSAKDTNHRSSRKRSLSPNSKAASSEREKKLQTEIGSSLKPDAKPIDTRDLKIVDAKPVVVRDLKIVAPNITQSAPSTSQSSTATVFNNKNTSSNMKKPTSSQQQPLIPPLLPPVPGRGLLGEAPIGHPPLASGSSHMQNRADPIDYNQPKGPGYLLAPPTSVFHNQGHVPNDQGPLKRPEDFQGPISGPPGPQSFGGMNSNIDGPPFEARDRGFNERGGRARPRDEPIMDDRPPREFTGLPRNNSQSGLTGPRRPSEARLPSLLGDGPMPPPGPDKFRDVLPVFGGRDEWRGPPGGDRIIPGPGGSGRQQKSDFRSGDQYHEELVAGMHEPEGFPFELGLPDQPGIRDQPGFRDVRKDGKDRNPEEFIGMQDSRGHIDQLDKRGPPGYPGMPDECFRGPQDRRDMRAPRYFRGPADQCGPQNSRGPPEQPNLVEPQDQHDTGFTEFRSLHHDNQDPSWRGPPDFRGPPNDHEFQGPPNHSEFRGPPNEQDYRGPPDFRGAPSQHEFRGPPNERKFRGPPNHGEFRGPPNEREFRRLPNDHEFKGTTDEFDHHGPPDFRGPLNQPEFRGPPNVREFRGPPNEREFRGPPNEREFRGPPNEREFRGPPNDQEFRGPPNEREFRRTTDGHDQHGPSDFRDPNMRGPDAFGGPLDRRDMLGPQDIRGPSDQRENRGPTDMQGDSAMEPYESYDQNEMEQEYYHEEPGDNFGPHSQHDFRGQSNFSDRVAMGNQRRLEQQDIRGSDFSNHAPIDNRGPPNHWHARGNRPGFNENRKPNFDGMPRDKTEHNAPFDQSFGQPKRQRRSFDGRSMNQTHTMEFRDNVNRKGINCDGRPSFDINRPNQDRSRDRDRPLDSRDGASERRAPEDDRGRTDRNKGQSTSRQTSRDGSDKHSLIRKDESSDSNKKENILDPKTTDKNSENLKESPAAGDSVSLATTAKQSDSKDINATLGSEKENDKKTVESNDMKGAMPALCTVVVENLPLETSYKDLRTLFTGCDISKKGIKMINDKEGKRTGKAYIRFTTQESYKKACLYDRSLMGNKKLVIKPISRKEYDNAVDSYYPSADEDDGDQSPDIDTCNTLSATLRALKGQPKLKLSPKSSVPKDFVIQVTNLPETATVESIRKFFSTCSIGLKGEAIYIESDKNKKCTGMCYVEFADDKSQQKALSQTLQFENKQVNISKATKKDVEELLKKEVSRETTVPSSQKPSSGAVNNNLKQSDVQLNIDSTSIKAQSLNKDPVETCVRVCNIPHEFRNIDVRSIFDNIDVIIKNCQVCHDAMGKPIGEAYIELNNSAEVQLCMVKNGAMVGRSRISLIPLLKSKMIENLRTLRQAIQPELPSSAAVFFFVKASNLPKGVTTGEIINFFSGYNPAPESIRLNINEQNETQGSSTALIGFRTREEAETAIERTNNNSLRNRRVTLTKVIL